MPKIKKIDKAAKPAKSDKCINKYSEVTTTKADRDAYLQQLQDEQRDYIKTLPFYFPPDKIPHGMDDDRDQRKTLFLFHLLPALGSISEACRLAKVSLRTIYRYCDEDENFAKAYKEIVENIYDKVETTLLEEILIKRNPTLLIFYAKCKMKQRGYIERTENININNNVDTLQIDNMSDTQLIELSKELSNKLKQIESKPKLIDISSKIIDIEDSND